MLKRKDRKLALNLLLLWLSSVLITELSQYDIGSMIKAAPSILANTHITERPKSPSILPQGSYQQAKLEGATSLSVTENYKPKPKVKAKIHAKTNAVKPISKVIKKVNVNRAETGLLVTIKGVGPKTALKILQYRKEHGDFKTLADLELVKGIGKKKLNLIKDHITFK